MNKFFNILIAMVVMAVFLVACDEDRDSNPTFKQGSETFVLNTPTLANSNVYDLKNSEYVVFTTNQPDYGGFPVATTYITSVSLDQENWAELPTTSQSVTVNIPASEINEAILSLAGDADLSQPIPLYVKMRAHVYGQDEMGVAESNAITLPKVLAYVPEVTIELPTTMFVVGDFPASSAWSTFVPLHLAYSQEGFFYGVVYMQAGAQFKVNPDAGWQGNDKGYGQVEAQDEANAGFHNGGDSETSNMTVDNAGWYNVVVKTKIANAAVNYTVVIKKAEVYFIGACEGGNWAGVTESCAFTAPADANGDWVSPTATGSGELRMFVDCGIDWWKTEFTIKSDGSLYYRDVDIPNNWAENVGEDYSTQINEGQAAYVNFTTNSGSVK